MTIKPCLLKKIVCSAWLMVMSSVVNAGQVFNGGGAITGLYIYPTYAVVFQGPTTAGPANCVNDAGWTFLWSDFPEPVQQRIMSTLLTARTTKASINITVADDGCGPEGKKKFTGQIVY